MVYYVGLDIGTSGCKAGVVDEDGKLLASEQREYAFTGEELWRMEVDPNEVWLHSAHCVRKSVQDSGVDPREITGIALSVLGEACMAVDERGEPLYPGMHGLDSRGNYYEEYMGWWGKEVGPLKIFQITSYPLMYFNSANKVLWFRDNRPDIFKQTYKFLTFQDFTIWKLTGAPAIDYAMASRTMLFDVVNHRWSAELLELTGLKREFFSDAHDSTEVVGEITEQAAKLTGLRPGTPVVVGASDQPCAALGVGAIREGVVMNGAGSSEAVGTPTKKPLLSEDMMKRGQGSQCHVRKDLWLALGFHLACGHLVKWTRDQLGQLEKQREEAEGIDAYDLITGQAAESPPGANGLFVLPHWMGSGTGVIPSVHPSSRGYMIGFAAAHSKADLFRAIFEGLNYELRIILESLEESGIPIEELKVTGGGAKSPFWLQLKADITQKKVVVPEITEASLLGAGLLAAVGTGVYPSLEEACDRTCRDRAVYLPNKDLAALYDKHFALYKELYPTLLPLSQKVNRLTTLQSS